MCENTDHNHDHAQQLIDMANAGIYSGRTMMQASKGALPVEAKIVAAQTVEPLRYEGSQDLAYKFTVKLLASLVKMQKELFDLFAVIAERRGEQPTSYQSTLNAVRLEKKKALTESDVIAALVDLAPYLTPEELAVFTAIFDTYAEDLAVMWEEYLRQAFQEGLDTGYDYLEMFARPGNPDAFAAVSESFIMSESSPFYTSFKDNALARVRAHLSVTYKTKVSRIISEELTGGGNWRSIGMRVHREIGEGNYWHWRRLVRTETAITYDNAIRQRYQDAGVEYEQISIAQGACPICSDAAGIYRRGEGPIIPLHPNCNCVRIPYFNLPAGAEVRPQYVSENQ